MQKTLKSLEYARFIALLVAARHKAGLNQQQVAKALGTPQSFVAKYEGGERRLDILEFLAVARALRLEPTKFLAGFMKGDTGSPARRPSKAKTSRQSR